MNFINYHLGELAALATAICWAGNAMFFENAGKKVGSFAVNYFRLFIGLFFLSIFTTLTRGHVFPIDADAHTWFWLFVSGIVGVVIGDMFLFEAFVVIGARISMLIMSLVPPTTALMGWLILGEKMNYLEISGMTVTVIGISIVILERDSSSKQMKLSHPVKGVLFALGGMLGQAAGLILSKYGVREYNAFAATQIRLIAGIFGFTIIFIFRNNWKKLGWALKDFHAITHIAAGSFLGPFIGISLSLIAVQRAKVGIASTLIALSPLIITVFSIIFRHEKIFLKEVFGIIIALSGVVIFFL
ncbi:MAG: DMT family transporter [Candidatus Marinimicrobia bacterium]|nr:DMT family transporter [Candidatus Neomarinimicrobiota bacterium]